MNIGIDKIAFHIPGQYIELKDLAISRGIDPDKFIKGLFIEQMSVAALSEDIISMAANAASKIVTEEDIKDIDMVLFATESGIDFSKSAATYIAGLLNLRKDIRAVELKHACYSATAALYFAKGHILQNPGSKVLILSADIAKYGIKNSAEPTQGAGAVAMIVSSNPHVLILNNENSVKTDDVYDFWRPNGHIYALVDGHFSDQVYQNFFLTVFNHHLKTYNQTVSNFDALLFHVPYSKIAYRSLKMAADIQEYPHLYDVLDAATKYSRRVGNIYTGSLYLSLVSLLENGTLESGNKIGLFSYGSGAVGEFFTGTLVKDYKNYLYQEHHLNLFKNRTKLSIDDYEPMVLSSLDFIEDKTFDAPHTNGIYLESVKDNKRHYSKK